METPADDLQGLLGKRVQARRRALKRTQRQVAEAVPIDFKYFGEIERGRKNITLETLAGIARVLDIEPYELLRPLDAVARAAVPEAARVSMMLEQLDADRRAVVVGVLEGFTAYHPRRSRPRRK